MIIAVLLKNPVSGILGVLQSIYEGFVKIFDFFESIFKYIGQFFQFIADMLSVPSSLALYLPSDFRTILLSGFVVTLLLIISGRSKG